TGLASAHADGLPVLLLSGEVPRSAFGRGALQEGSSYGFDAIGMARPICKMAAQITRPQIAAATVKRALATMTSGKPGPAFLTIPLDVQSAEVSQQLSAGTPYVEFDIDRDSCRAVATLLAQAERPLIVVGAGARALHNREAVARLAHAAQVPV